LLKVEKREGDLERIKSMRRQGALKKG